MLSQILKLLCPLTLKWRPFQVLVRFVKNPFHWLIFFNFKYHVLVFINESNAGKRKQGSGKFKIWKVLIGKRRPFLYLAKFEKIPSCLHLK